MPDLPKHDDDWEEKLLAFLASQERIRGERAAMRAGAKTVEECVQILMEEIAGYTEANVIGGAGASRGDILAMYAKAAEDLLGVPVEAEYESDDSDMISITWDRTWALPEESE